MKVLTYLHNKNKVNVNKNINQIKPFIPKPFNINNLAFIQKQIAKHKRYCSSIYNHNY